MRLPLKLAAVCLSAVSLAACANRNLSALPVREASLPAAAGGFKVLYTFKGGTDGDNPRAGLVAMNGKFYGVTFSGGTNGKGTVFEIDSAGAERVVYSFGGGTDGAYPDADLLAVHGALYGTTSSGGGNNNCECGTVFEVRADGTEHVLHRFNGLDGAYPATSLIEFDGALYGTAPKGGPDGADAGSGTVFKLTGDRFTLLYAFAGYPSDAAQPQAGLVDLGGTLYGTSLTGGDGKCPLGHHVGCGAVFAIEPGGKEHVVYSFQRGGDPTYPVTSLITKDGRLYGTADWGGAHGFGAVFDVEPSGKERLVYSFTGERDGKHPDTALIAVGDSLYGTTAHGALGEAGTVYSLSGAGYEVLHTFTRKGEGGEYPRARLLAANGLLYGTTTFGGAGGINGRGTVFELAP